MKIVRKNTFDIPDTNLRRWVEDLHKLTNRNISFGTQVDGQDQNIAGHMVDVANTGAANTQFAVTHNLGRIPLFYDVKYINGNGVVYDSGTAWTKTQAFFKCSLATAHIRLFIH
jgi:hypothetical protein